MYKNPINAYKTQISTLQLDKRSETIIAKAKRYNILALQNQALTKTLLQSTLTNTNTSLQAIQLFKWFLECEAKTQISKTD